MLTSEARPCNARRSRADSRRSRERHMRSRRLWRRWRLAIIQVAQVWDPILRARLINKSALFVRRNTSHKAPEFTHRHLEMLKGRKLIRWALQTALKNGTGDKSGKIWESGDRWSSSRFGAHARLDTDSLSSGFGVVKRSPKTSIQDGRLLDLWRVRYWFAQLWIWDRQKLAEGEYPNRRRSRRLWSQLPAAKPPAVTASSNHYSIFDGGW